MPYINSGKAAAYGNYKAGNIPYYYNGGVGRKENKIEYERRREI